MEETRVDRYKEYRKSFIKEGAIESNGEEDVTIDVHTTSTSTLPMKEVINTVQGEMMKDDLQRSSRRKHVLIILLKVGISILLLAGLAVLGYFAFRG